MRGKRGFFWPFVMIFALLLIAVILTGSYYYLGLVADKAKQSIESVEVDAEQKTFLPLLLKKSSSDVTLAEKIIDAERKGDYAGVKREINEWLFKRFGKDVEWNLLINDVERTDNQLTGFLGGRKFFAYLPAEGGKSVLKVELEVNDDAWGDELHAPYFSEAVR